MKKLLAILILSVLIVSFVACDDAKTNSETAGNSATPTPIIDFPTQTNVVVSTEHFPENTVIQIETVGDNSKVKSILTTAQSVEVYDIIAVLNNEKVQPNGDVEITFPIPKGYNADKHIIEVYFISDDGKTEKIDTAIIYDTVVARVRHFSIYAVAIIEKPTFKLAVDAKPDNVDGQKALISDRNLKIAYNPGDTWRAFAEKNKAAGFIIDKDFYGVKDIVYYEENDTRYQIVNAVGLLEVKPEDEIRDSDYACMIPHRESIQCQWFYEVSNDPFMVEGYLEPFHRQGKTIIIDTSLMTYTIKHIKLQKISAYSHVSNEVVIASGKYTSDDGDTLGATLTFDNGYVLKTSRSQSFIATLIIDGKSITAKTADQYNFYEF